MSLRLPCYITQTNRKLEEFLEAKEAVQEEQRRLEANENRAKVIERIETEKAQVSRTIDSDRRILQRNGYRWPSAEVQHYDQTDMFVVYLVLESPISFVHS